MNKETLEKANSLSKSISKLESELSTWNGYDIGFRYYSIKQDAYFNFESDVSDSLMASFVDAVKNEIIVKIQVAKDDLAAL